MFLDFFLILKNQGVKVTLKEYLDLLQALNQGVISQNVDEFYYLSKAALIKRESDLDKFDQLFASYFKGLETIKIDDFLHIPEDWLLKNSEKFLSPEEMEQIKSMGGLEEILDRMKELLKEQKKRHEGGNKWIGTGGTSPFGAYGYNPEGMRIGQDESRHKSAIKVWDKREFKNLDDNLELDTRNMKMALRKLRVLTKEGGIESLDLPKTIQETSDNAGYLKIEMAPKKKNNVKVLMLFDIGGSMDPFIETCSQLFSAAKYEFKHLEYFYFHNCVYEKLWKDSVRRWDDFEDTWAVLNKFNSDYKIVFVGDASMSPYELQSKFGSVEHYNEETGTDWLERFTDHFDKVVWLNPIPEKNWDYTSTIKTIKGITENKMYPLTVNGIEKAIVELKR
ncbi:MAG: hypothetical protein ACI9J3_001060 [Parvicellaceae bacterium]|jgi:uncharacterized protein with von Willebrand factor type A (vWA) domain